MQINRTNYEAFVLDYLEGNLTPEVRQQVEAFLLAHPDIQAECEDLMGVALPQDELLFEDKQKLKIEDDISHADWLMMHVLDGEATAAEREELNALLLDPIQARNFEALKLAVLRPDPQPFEDKSSLRVADRLTPQQERQLHDANAFPALQPLLSETFDKSNIYFPDTVDWSNDSDLAAAFAEGDLPAELHVVARQKMADSPEFARNVKMLRQLRLKPQTLVFDGKASLKQKEGRVILFTPNIRRAVAIAAVFVVSLGIWRPWENQGVVTELASEPIATPVQSPSNAPASALEVAATDQNQLGDTSSQAPMKKPSVPAPGVLPNNDDMAQQQPTPKDHKVDFKKDSISVPVMENPTLPEQDGNIAQAPTEPAVHQDYVPIAKDNALKPAETNAPVTLLAFLGDKLEERIEQSQVYSFLDKKKKEMFQSDEVKEPVRFERFKSASQIKQKLILWGLEFERTKRRK